MPMSISTSPSISSRSSVVAVEIESVFFVDALDLDIILFFVGILVEEEVFVLRGVSRSRPMFMAKPRPNRNTN